MTKRQKLRKRVMIAVLVCLILALIFLISCIDWVANNPYNSATYSVKSTKCTRDEAVNKCTILVKIKNNSFVEFTPDFTGTDGPGFAETGIWGVYVIDSNGEKAEGYLDRDAYGGTIPQKATVEAPVNIELDTDVVPREILIFDHKIELVPQGSE